MLPGCVIYMFLDLLQALQNGVSVCLSSLIEVDSAVPCLLLTHMTSLTEGRASAVLLAVKGASS